PEAIEHVYFGNCLMAGQGQAPARQALRKAGLPDSTGAVTLSKMCGSAMQTTMFAHDTLLAGSADVVVAGGMESMTNAPYLVPKARGGYRIGHGMIYDHMMMDGLEDAYSRDEKGNARSMGTFAEECASQYSFTREAQDAFAIESVKRAQAATKDGSFAWEIVPVTVSGRGGDTIVSIDEGPQKARLEKIPTLKAAFKKDGTITAASSSSINDGAAALVLMRESTAKKLGCTVIARIHGHATHAQAPNEFTTAPIAAIKKLVHNTPPFTSPSRPNLSSMGSKSEGYLFDPEAELDLQMRGIYWESIQPSNFLVMRGIQALIKCDMLAMHPEFQEEAAILAFVALDASFELVKRFLRTAGIS
ncbi:MAG: acetyl-CoA C-acyltransferase, partial [Rickettsiales bacterium]|nr:acetyl-CoA C-acyltransferase [Rickettsiales bacterium]